MDPKKPIENAEVADDNDSDLFSSLADLDEGLDVEKFSAEDLGTGEGEADDTSPEAAVEATADEKSEGDKEKAVETTEPPKAEADTQKETPAQVVTEAKAVESPAPQEPIIPPAQPENLQAQYQEFLTRSVDSLEKTVYALTDEQKEQLDTSPSELLPKLAATVHMQVLTQAATYMANMLPQMIPMIMERDGQDQQAESKFFMEFPQLKDHRDDVFRVARAYRQANPDIKGDQAIREIGTMAMVALRLPVSSAQSTASEVVSRPVVPTSAQGGSAPMPSRTQGNVFSDLVDLEED